MVVIQGIRGIETRASRRAFCKCEEKPKVYVWRIINRPYRSLDRGFVNFDIHSTSSPHVMDTGAALL